MAREKEAGSVFSDSGPTVSASLSGGEGNSSAAPAAAAEAAPLPCDAPEALPAVGGGGRAAAEVGRQGCFPGLGRPHAGFTAALLGGLNK